MCFVEPKGVQILRGGTLTTPTPGCVQRRQQADPPTGTAPRPPAPGKNKHATWEQGALVRQEDGFQGPGASRREQDMATPGHGAGQGTAAAPPPPLFLSYGSRR